MKEMIGRVRGLLANEQIGGNPQVLRGGRNN